MADLLEAARQDVLEETAEELRGFQGQATPAAGAALSVREGDVSLLAGEDPVVADGDTEDVGSEVLERCPSITDACGVHDPVLAPHGGNDLLEETGRLHYPNEGDARRAMPSGVPLWRVRLARLILKWLDRTNPSMGVTSPLTNAAAKCGTGELW
jgi:hypothetical protein